MNAVLVDAIRTPFGKYGGLLSSVRPDDMMAHLLRIMADRYQLGKRQIDDVVIGCTIQAGEDARNVARMAVLIAGLPFDVPGQTINRLCGSSMQAIISSASMIQSGHGNLYLAGGVESMSRGPFVFSKAEKAFPFGGFTVYDTSLGWRFPNKKIENRIRPLNMGETAEEIFDLSPVTRVEQDEFALRSHQRALAAWKAGVFSSEVVPITIRTKKGESLIERDECPRQDSSLDILAKLKPAFRKNGTVTAGNSCPMNDGASLTLMMEEEEAKRSGFTEYFRLRASAVTGLHPDIMGMGPVEASRKALQRAGLTMKDMEVVEINEAFAIQAIACSRELDVPEDKLNVNGGAIAIGHPLGASGARIVGTLVHEMKRRQAKIGLATMCIGLGQGIATVWERVKT